MSFQRDGHLKRFYEFSRTTRYRIRNAQRFERQDNNTSSEEELEPVGHLPRQVLRARRRVGAARLSSSGDSSGAGHRDEALNQGQNLHNRSSDISAGSDTVSGSDEAEAAQNMAQISASSSPSSSTDDSNNVASSADEFDDQEDGSGISNNGTSEVSSNVSNNADSDLDSGPPEPSSHTESSDEDEIFHEAEDYGWDRDDDEPLYEDAPLTLGESMLAIVSFVLHYHISGACLADLLKLIALHCREQSNHCKKTLFQFRKFFENIQFPLKRHYFCSACYSLLESKDEVCGLCERNRGVQFFIEIPLISQLRTLFKRPGFRESLQHRFTRRKQNPLNYEDIFDGSVYKSLSSEDNILSNPCNISMTWNTDGVPIFKSSKYQLWPFYLIINELPYNQRTALPNALLAGLWFGSSKPSPNIFLKPIRDSLLRLGEGIDFQCSNPDEIINVKGIVLCGTCDLPAKATFLNIKQHNGRHGCPKCKMETVNIGRGKNVYPFRQHLNLRTDAETLEHAQEALRLPRINGERQAVFGVKGPTILSTCVYQCVRTTAVDSMHCLFLGLVKMLLKLWFDPKFRHENFSLARYARLINQRLTSLSPPSFVKRLPRNLKDSKYWKAYELKMFLFYYSIPLFQDVMSALYFDHHILLVNGIYMLCKSSISEDMVMLASELLTEYVSQFENLYGLSYMTCNVHQLLHLPNTVRDFGPLWVTSCFPFEDLNGKIKTLINGTRYAELQVCSSLSMLFKVDELTRNLRESPVSEFCSRLADKCLRLKLTRISRVMSIVGVYKKVIRLPVMVQEALERSNINGTNFYVFTRLLKYRIVFGSHSYNRSSKTDSSCVLYVSDNINKLGFVHSYVRVSNCQCEDFCLNCNAEYYAIVRKSMTTKDFSSWPGAEVNFVHRYIRHDETVAMNVENLIGVCFAVNISDRDVTYIVETVNFIEPE